MAGPRSVSIGPSTNTNGIDSLQFNEEIQRLMSAPPENASSFTALLELPAPQAVELLHHSPGTQGVGVAVDAPGAPYRFHGGANLTFPSNIALIERAARFSVFAGENHNTDNKSVSDNINKNNWNYNNNSSNNSPENTRSVPSNSSGNPGKVKNEPAVSDSNNDDENNNNNDYSQTSSQAANIQGPSQRSAKRKEREKKVR